MAVQPDRPGAQHRPGRDRGGQRRPVAEDHRRRARRDPRAEGDAQHDGRPAAVLRRRGHARRARGRHAGRARRPGRGRGRQRHVARPDPERQPARRQPHDAGARDRRGLHRRDAGRPHAPDLRRGAGRGRRAVGHDQPDDRQPARDDAEERRAGLAEHEPRADLRPHAGPARPRDGLAADHVRDLAARLRPARRVLPHARRQRRRARAAAHRQLRLPEAQVGLQPLQDRRGARRPGGAGGQEHPHLRRARRTTSRSPPASARRRR